MISNKNISIIIAISVTIIVFFGSIFIGNLIKINIGNKSLVIEGVFGKNIDYNQIERVELLNDFPMFGVKIVGVDMYFFNFGIYSYREYGKVRLFELNKQKPYLLIKIKDENIVIAMGGNKNKEYYTQIMKKIIMD